MRIDCVAITHNGLLRAENEDCILCDGWMRNRPMERPADFSFAHVGKVRVFAVADGRLVRLVANLGRGLPPVWRGLSLDQATLISLCREAGAGDSEKAALVETLFERGILDVWGDSGNKDSAAWSKQWKSSSKKLFSPQCDPS